jgi:hypothetical protein
LPKDCQMIAIPKNVQKNAKNLSSRFYNYFFCALTLNFNYRKEDSFFHKVFGFSQNGQKKCPKWENQNTFQIRKRKNFSSYVVNKKWVKILKSHKIPTICSSVSLNCSLNILFILLKELSILFLSFSTFSICLSSVILFSFIMTFS